MTRASMAAAVAAVMAFAACSHGTRASGPGPAAFASGTLIDSAGHRVGVATVVDSAGTVRLAISAGGLTPGPHGLHLHERGTCTPPDFASAGGHLNPDGRKHGRRNPEGPHAGDLANLMVEADGSADTSFSLPPDLVGAGPRSLIRPGGTALVIHARADDERSDPSGNAGERVACAVLEPG